MKRGILLGFRMGAIVEMTAPGAPLQFLDKDTYPIRRFSPDDRVRIVPGGSSIRDGAYIAPGVVCMPPMFVNAGAYVDEGTMIDSHALVGSCAQIGKRVHLSAAAQIGGVLEPAGAMPVIIEDDVIVGGNCGVYEGAIVRERAVLASGTIITPPNAPIGGVVECVGGIKLFAGQRRDPFFNYIPFALASTAALATGTSPDYDALRPAHDDFKNTSVRSYVLEVPVKITGLRAVNYWATTAIHDPGHNAWFQLQRAAGPNINTDWDFRLGSAHVDYNASAPTDDLKGRPANPETDPASGVWGQVRDTTAAVVEARGTYGHPPHRYATSWPWATSGSGPGGRGPCCQRWASPSASRRSWSRRESRPRASSRRGRQTGSARQPAAVRTSPPCCTAPGDRRAARHSAASAAAGRCG